MSEPSGPAAVGFDLDAEGAGELDAELEYSDAAGDEDNSPNEIPQEERVLRTQAYDKSISDVVRMIEDEDIILDPEYQRNYVWDTKKASLLIESILLNVPIPVVYVAEDEDSRWTVVDGLQRLNTLRRFFSNEFRLRGLEVLQELNGMQYSTLNPKAGRILRSGILRIILIFKESHPEIKYDIFMRLNRGAIKLNEQELRNCLYRGALNTLLKDLRSNRRLLTILNLTAPHKRMDDAELILRYFALSDSYDGSTGKLRGFLGKMKPALNKFMTDNRKADERRIGELQDRFNSTIEKVYSVFGNRAFRRINRDGSYDRQLNRAIMDVVMVSFEHYAADRLVERKDAIHDLLRELPTQDFGFMEAISIATSDRPRIEYRLAKWHAALNEILED